MPRRSKDGSLNIRFTAAQLIAIAKATAESGQCSNRTEFVRIAVAEKIADERLEKNIAETIVRHMQRQERRLKRIEEGQQLTYAAMAAMARQFLRYTPEPPDAQLKFNQATLEQRYRRFLHEAIMVFEQDAGPAFERLNHTTE